MHSGETSELAMFFKTKKVHLVAGVDVATGYQGALPVRETEDVVLVVLVILAVAFGITCVNVM